MSLSLYTNEPSPLNTTFCGSSINLLRDHLSKIEATGDKTTEVLAFNRFYHVVGIAILALGSGIEGCARSLAGLAISPIYLMSSDSLSSFMKQNAKATLTAFKIFFVVKNPISLVAFTALSALPKSFQNDCLREEQKEKLKQLGHLGQIGSCGLISGSSFLNSSFFGKKINEVRTGQTEFERTDRTQNEIAKSRALSFGKYISYGLLAGMEAAYNLTKILGYSSYLRTKKLIKVVGNEEKIQQNQKLIELARTFFTSLIIFSSIVDLKFLLVTAIEHAHPDAYAVPGEIRSIYEVNDAIV